MAKDVSVGTVSAKFVMDISELESSLKTVKESLKAVTSAFKEFGNANTNKNLTTTIKTLQELSSTQTKVAESNKQMKEATSSSIKSIEQMEKEAKSVQSTLTGVKNEVKSLNNEFSVSSASSFIDKMAKLKSEMKDVETSIQGSTTQLRNFNKQFGSSASVNNYINKLSNFKKMQQELMSSGTGYLKYSSQYNRKRDANQELKQLEAWKRVNSVIHQVEAGFNLLSQTVGNVDSKFDRSTRKVAEMGAEYKRVFEQLQSISRMIDASFVPNVTRGMNLLGQTLSGNNSSLNATLREVQQSRTLTNKFNVVPTSLGSGYSNYLGQINNVKSSMKELTTATTQMGVATQSTANKTQGLTSRLGNLLGVSSRLKSIFTMVSSLFVWQFANSLFEATSEAVSARSEMDSLFAQMKLGADDIQVMNNALDETIGKFQKMNRYSLGETIASLGVEFNLTTDQMSKALPILSMVQSEYLRAGRSTEEATLAVKDIMQGEMLRLSRETGVGKSELKQAGWNGNVQTAEDIDSLLDALQKVGEARHWDTFASKATSLNDILLITQNRFSEFASELVAKITPDIITGFNMIVVALDILGNFFGGISSAFGNFSFLDNAVVKVLAFGTALGVATTAIVAHRTGMGLLEIAQAGLGKSIVGTIFKIDKETLALNSLSTSLGHTITKYELATVKQNGFWRSLIAKIAGVQEATLAEAGFANSLAITSGRLDAHSVELLRSRKVVLNWHQALAVMTKGVELEVAQEMKWHQSLRAVLTSMVVAKVVAFSAVIIGLAIAFGSLYSACQKAKDAVERFNNVQENGEEIINKAQTTYENYAKRVTELQTEIANSDSPTAKQKKDLEDATNARIQSYKNLGIAQQAYNEAKKIQTELDQRQASAMLKNQNILAENYIKLGMSSEEAFVEASQYTRDVREGGAILMKAQDEYNSRLYASQQHMNEHLTQLEKAGVSNEAMKKYMEEYNTEALKTAEFWKKFNEGDMWSGLYAIMSELTLWWIDFNNNPEVIEFWQDLHDIWSDCEPVLRAIGEALKNFGWESFKAFAGFIRGMNDIVGSGGTIAVLTAGIYGVAKAVSYLGTVLKDKAIMDSLPTIGGIFGKGKDKDKDGSDKKDKDKGKDKTKDKKSGGGVWKRGESSTGKWGTDVVNDLKSQARVAVRMASGIAIAMVLISEAILLLSAPMSALALIGQYSSSISKNLEKGVKTIKMLNDALIQNIPILIAFVATIAIFSRMSLSQQAQLAVRGATGIAIAIGLITEAIALLALPLWALGSIGASFNKGEVDKGIEAMNSVNEALNALVPWIPVFIAGIALASLTMTGVGAIALVAVAGGIATGVLMVVEAIKLMELPLQSLADLGNTTIDVEQAKRGADIVKQVSEALGYLSDGMGSVADIAWADLKTWIASGGKDIKDVLEGLNSDDGVISELAKFPAKFNEVTEGIVPIDTSKAQALKDSANALKTINDTMTYVKDIVSNTSNLQQGSVNTGKGQSPQQTALGVAFDTIKNDIDAIMQFNKDLNEIEISAPPQAMADALSQSSTIISSIKSACETAKEAVGASNEVSQTAKQSTGAIGMIGAWFGGSKTNAGEGGSGLKTGLVQLYNDVLAILDFNRNVSTAMANSGGAGNTDVSGLTAVVKQVSDAVTGISTALNNGLEDIGAKAKALGVVIVDGIKFGLSPLSSEITTFLSTAFNAPITQAGEKGREMGVRTVDGFKFKLNSMSNVLVAELGECLRAMSDKKQAFYDKGAELGKAITDGFNSTKAIDHHSPGAMARLIIAENWEIENALNSAVPTLYSAGERVGSAITTGMSNGQGAGTGLSFDTGEVNQYATDLSQAMALTQSTANNANTTFIGMDTTVTTSFGNIGSTVLGTFDSITANTTSNYSKMASTTKIQLGNMQSQTTKNIDAIQTSWRGMQTALIQSAENIRSQTGQKITNLENNMARFWRKVQNPALLIAGAGGHSSGNNHSSPRSISSRRTVARVLPRGGYAGGLNTGINSSMYPRKRSRGSPDDLGLSFLQCLADGGNCYAGGWNFNWSPQIQKKLDTWRTHFGAIYDNKLRVGKFYNNDFPVRGDAEIAKNYIVDAISRTTYEKYFDSKYGSALNAWNAGHFNCYDGALVVMALARAFGLGSYMKHGSWNGIPHVWAYVEGIGDVDATAIQGGYGLTSPKVSGGKPTTAWRKWASDDGSSNSNTSNNVSVTFNMEGAVIKDEDTARMYGDIVVDKISELLGVNPATGR